MNEWFDEFFFFSSALEIKINFGQTIFIHLSIEKPLSTPTVHKSRSSRRSKAAELQEVPQASRPHSHVTGDTMPGASQTTRLKELLSPASCSQPPSLKPRPPSMPKIRERPSSITHIPSISVSSMDQTEASSREGISLKKRDTHTSVHAAHDNTDAHTSSQKQRNHKELTSERATTKDQTHTPSFRRSSSSDHKSPSRKTGTHALISARTHKGHNKDQRRRRNEAAQIIQRAWRR